MMLFESSLAGSMDLFTTKASCNSIDVHHALKTFVWSLTFMTGKGLWLWGRSWVWFVGNGMEWFWWIFFHNFCRLCLHFIINSVLIWNFEQEFCFWTYKAKTGVCWKWRGEASCSSSKLCRGMLLTCLWWKADPSRNFYVIKIVDRVCTKNSK